MGGWCLGSTFFLRFVLAPVMPPDRRRARLEALADEVPIALTAIGAVTALVPLVHREHEIGGRRRFR